VCEYTENHGIAHVKAVAREREIVIIMMIL
jgi:hypothetical protein